MKLPDILKPLENREELKKQSLNIFGKLIRTKNVEQLQGELHESDDKKRKLQKCLTTLDLTSLGVGSCVGTGMYLVAGMVAKNYAGPGVIFSFIIAAVASIFSGKRQLKNLVLLRNERKTRMPHKGT